MAEAPCSRIHEIVLFCGTDIDVFCNCWLPTRCQTPHVRAGPVEQETHVSLAEKMTVDTAVGISFLLRINLAWQIRPFFLIYHMGAQQ